MRLLNSVVVSAMVSETRIFTCYEFPEWMRWLWVVWALLPTVAARLFVRASGVVGVAIQIQTDFITGLEYILGLFLPVGVAAG